MKPTPKARIGLVAATCAVAGAAAGIAGSAAAPGLQPNAGRANAEFGPHGPLGRGLGGPPVHATVIVLNRAGTAFETATEDRGAFKTLSGDQLTITEGTKTVTYHDATLTVPANATIYRNDAAAKLSDLRSGDEVRVSQSPEGTFVSAEDAAHQAQHFGRHWGRPDRDGPGSGPPGGSGPLPPPPGG